MAISTNPDDPNFGLETDDTSPNFGLPAQQEGGVISGIAAGIGRMLNPVNLVRGALDIQPRSGLQEVLRTGRMLRDIVGGASVGETLQKEAPEVSQQQEALLGKYGVREQAAEWTGLAGQAALLAAPALFKSARPTLREVAFGERPIEATHQIPETPITDAVTIETQKPIGGDINAEQISEPTQVHGDVQYAPRPEEGAGPLPADVSGEGVPTRGQGEVVQQTTQEVTPEAEPPPPAAAAPEAPPTIEGSVETPPEVQKQTGISNQRLTEAYGDSAPVATTGKGPAAWKDEGLSRLDDFQKTGNAQNDPYAVLTKSREQGIATPSDVALLRAEHQRLLEDARNAEGTAEYSAKSQAALDMATAIKGVAHGPASDIMRGLQEYDQPRYDNVTDFDQALREREGRESTSTERVQFKKMADDVASTRNGAEAEITSVQKKISKYPRMEFEDAYKSIHDQITELTKDCIIR